MLRQSPKELIRREFIVDYRPGAGVRISPHFYTKDEELELVIAEMKKIRDQREFESSGKAEPHFDCLEFRVYAVRAPPEGRNSERIRTLMKLFLDSPDFLSTVASETDKNIEAARTLTSGLTESQLNWKPSTEQWSIAQCLDHLTVATNEFEKYFETALRRAREKWPVTNSPRYKPSMLGGWLAKTS
jgi:hypothetical protein